MSTGARTALGKELAVFKYAFTSWRTQTEALPGEMLFSGHRRNAYPATLGAIVMVVVVETAAVHILLTLWIGHWAWIATGLGIYSLIWLMGDFNAARLNPSRVSASGLELRTGLRWQVDLDWATIVRLREAAPSEDSVSMTLMGKPDLWLELREPTEVLGPFGIRRRVRFVGIGVDDAKGLVEAIQRFWPGGGGEAEA